MTSTNVAAQIVSDEIMKKPNKYADVFTATRVKPIKNRWEVENMVKETANSIALNKFKIEPYSVEQIENDNGVILKINGENVGIYKDKVGKIYAVVCYLGIISTKHGIVLVMEVDSIILEKIFMNLQ